MRFFSFLLFEPVPGVRCSNQAEKYYTRGDADFFSFPSFRFHLHCFYCCVVLCFRFLRTYEYRHRASISKEENKYIQWYPTYVRTYGIRDAKRMWHPSWRRSFFFLKHGGGTLGIIKSPVCNFDLNSIVDLCHFA